MPTLNEWGRNNETLKTDFGMGALQRSLTLGLPFSERSRITGRNLYRHKNDPNFAMSYGKPSDLAFKIIQRVIQPGKLKQAMEKMKSKIGNSNYSQIQSQWNTLMDKYKKLENAASIMQDFSRETMRETGPGPQQNEYLIAQQEAQKGFWDYFSTLGNIFGGISDKLNEGQMPQDKDGWTATDYLNFGGDLAQIGAAAYTGNLEGAAQASYDLFARLMGLSDHSMGDFFTAGGDYIIDWMGIK